MFEPCSTGFGVYFPDLPGCVASGSTIEVAVQLATEALTVHYCSMEKDGDIIPNPSGEVSEEDAAGNVVVPITICSEIFTKRNCC